MRPNIQTIKVTHHAIVRFCERCVEGPVKHANAVRLIKRILRAADTHYAPPRRWGCDPNEMARGRKTLLLNRRAGIIFLVRWEGAVGDCVVVTCGKDQAPVGC